MSMYYKAAIRHGSRRSIGSIRRRVPVDPMKTGRERAPSSSPVVPVMVSIALVGTLAVAKNEQVTSFCHSKPSTQQHLLRWYPKQSFQVSDIYKIKKILGKGSFATVFSAVRSQDGSTVALKAVNQTSCHDKDFHREVKAMDILSKPGNSHVCQLYDQHEDDDFYYMAMELGGESDLYDHLMQQGTLGEERASQLMHQLVDALSYIHSKGLIHADLKPENLMVDEKNFKLKVVDFGNTVFVGEPEESLPSMTSGTTAYMPPEILDSKQHHRSHLSEHLTPAMDMYAVGIILYICLTGTHPFDPNGVFSDKEVAHAILNSRMDGYLDYFVFGDRTKDLSPSAVQLMKKLLHPVPSQRMTADELKEHLLVREDCIWTTTNGKKASINKFLLDSLSAKQLEA